MSDVHIRWIQMWAKKKFHSKTSQDFTVQYKRNSVSLHFKCVNIFQSPTLFTNTKQPNLGTFFSWLIFEFIECRICSYSKSQQSLFSHSNTSIYAFTSIRLISIALWRNTLNLKRFHIIIRHIGVQKFFKMNSSSNGAENNEIDCFNRICIVLHSNHTDSPIFILLSFKNFSLLNSHKRNTIVFSSHSSSL